MQSSVDFKAELCWATYMQIYISIYISIYYFYMKYAPKHTHSPMWLIARRSEKKIENTKWTDN